MSKKSEVSKNKFKIGDIVRCNGPYTFDPSMGIIIRSDIITKRVQLFQCNKPSDYRWNKEDGWVYYGYELEKLDKRKWRKEYLIYKLKE